MEYQVSARAYRPQTFDQVIGQPHIVTTLINAVKGGKIAQAYLFSGIRGVGKTTMARLFAKALNCRPHPARLSDQAGEVTPVPPCNTCDSCVEITRGGGVDVLEIDGASNTGVDDIRELRENVKYLPLIGKYKIYIIDEVHMLSNAAFNALLKTLEEPPPHLVFILATTEWHKLPATILSRCQHFTFRRISRVDIVKHLEKIALSKKVECTSNGFMQIAADADGSMRDALVLLDQAIAYCGQKITEEDLLILLGRMGEERFHQLIRAIHGKDASACLSLVSEISDRGIDLRQFLADWMVYLRHLIVVQSVPDPAPWIDLTKETIVLIQKEALLFSQEEMHRLFSLFSKLQEDIRNTPHPHLLFEVALMRAILFSRLQPVEAILEKLNALGRPSSLLPTSLPKPTAPSSPFSTPVSMPATPLPKKLNVVSKPIPPSVRVPSLSNDAPPADDALLWKKLITDVRGQKSSVASLLEQGRLLEGDQETVKVAFSESRISLIQNEENIKLLTPLFKTHFNRKVQFIVEKVSASEKGREPHSLTKVAFPAGDARHDNHPFVQETLKILGGTIIETKHLE